MKFHQYIPAFSLLCVYLPSYAASGDTLSQQTAQQRAKLISEVSYRLDLNLPEQTDIFTGEETLQFKLNSVKQAIRIDFTQGEIKALSVNGHKLPQFAYNHYYLLLPTQWLTLGNNRVEISYTHAYTNNGVGLYRFKDPEDGKVYLYSKFEPFDANQMFPCFDQPDIKATYTLRVKAPASWTVISTEREQTVSAQQAGFKTWQFPTTLPLSTYVFSLHAGPYHVWQDTTGKIPLRLFARESVSRYVDAIQWFNMTQQGLQYFNHYFAYPYPFHKYDQLIVPNFNAGAMENVGAITYAETYLFKAKPTASQYAKWLTVILHEMAHMWFGNLVTMQWWDDLWLNESFASYLAAKASDQALAYKDTWLNFYYTNLAGYEADSLHLTTHPILSKVQDAKAASSQFDAITYRKGAAVLKQLDYYIGEETFRTGIRHYIKQHAYHNTRLTDFFAALQTQTPKDLNVFAKQWLTTTGFNKVKLIYSCNKQHLAELSICQTDKPLRNHQALLGFYAPLHGTTLPLRQTLAVSYQGACTHITPPQVNCPSFIYPNEQGLDYAQSQLEPSTVALLRQHIHGLQQPLTRALAWQGLWEQVLAYKLSLPAFLATVQQQLAQETEPQILQWLIGKLQLGLSYLPTHNKPSQLYRSQYLASIEHKLWDLLRQARPGSEQQRFWLDSLAQLTEQPASLKQLAGLLNGELKINGLELNQTQRWQIIKTLASFGYSETEKLIKQESEKDRSNEGIDLALAATVSQANFTIKQSWFKQITEPNSSLSFNTQRLVMRNLFPTSQTQLMAQFSPLFFQQLLKLQDKSELYLREYCQNLVPKLCSIESSKHIARFLATHPKLTLATRKALLIAEEDTLRCSHIRQTATQALQQHKNEQISLEKKAALVLLP
jgi:aminopeptidase N